MNIKIMKIKKKVISKLINLWYFIMKPLAFMLKKTDTMKYNTLVNKCKNMTDEELIRRFTKYLMKSMVKQNKSKTEFIIFNKRGYNSEDLDEERLIFNELRNINYKYRDKQLKNWHYHSEKAKLWYAFNDKDERLPAYEKKLNGLLKNELDRIGVNNEYVDIREVGYKGQDDKYDFYSRYLDDIGYEKTLVIYL